MHMALRGISLVLAALLFYVQRTPPAPGNGRCSSR